MYQIEWKKFQEKNLNEKKKVVFWGRPRNQTEMNQEDLCGLRAINNKDLESRQRCLSGCNWFQPLPYLRLMSLTGRTLSIPWVLPERTYYVLLPNFPQNVWTTSSWTSLTELKDIQAETALHYATTNSHKAGTDSVEELVIRCPITVWRNWAVARMRLAGWIRPILQ